MDQSLNMVKIAYDALDDKLAEDIKIIDIRSISVLADYFIIADGNNKNQVQAMVDNVQEELFKAGYEMKQMEGYREGNWILLDFGDIIIHIFDKENRLFYDLERIWKDGKEVAVPKVFGKDMIFYRLTDFSQLEAGYFGIPEPREDGQVVSWEEAMMVMPGVAFDVNCNRVGYGGGFYDRFLEKHPKIQRVAVGFSFQMLSEVPTEDTDICPQVIVTEEQVYRDIQ